MKLTWTREEDDDGNTVWTAPGPYRDTDASWRLEQRIRDDRIVWIAQHTDELSESHGGDFWLTIDAAKREIEKAHANVLADSTDIYEDEE